MKEGENRRLVEQNIYLIRNHKIMLDSDLAQLYGTETGALVRAVQRNREPKNGSCGSQTGASG
jgi:hypothetical protein